MQPGLQLEVVMGSSLVPGLVLICGAVIMVVAVVVAVRVVAVIALRAGLGVATRLGFAVPLVAAKAMRTVGATFASVLALCAAAVLLLPRLLPLLQLRLPVMFLDAHLPLVSCSVKLLLLLLLLLRWLFLPAHAATARELSHYLIRVIDHVVPSQPRMLSLLLCADLLPALLLLLLLPVLALHDSCIFESSPQALASIRFAPLWVASG